MNLYKIYHDICNRGHERGTKRKKGFELHHILPKSMNGTNDPSNLCLLTPKEHYVVHHCLARTGNSKMIFAFLRMIRSKGQNSHRITAKEFEEIKLNLKHSDEAKQKISIARKGMKFSDETRKRISEAGIGRKHTEEAKRKISKAGIGRKMPPCTEETRKRMSIIHLGKKHTEETKLKLSEIAKKQKRIPFSEETKLKISESLKLRFQKKQTVH